MWRDISVVHVSMLCQWYLTKLVGEIFLWYKYPCYVNDISRSRLMRFFCGTSISVMSIISHKISLWGISWHKWSMWNKWYSECSMRSTLLHPPIIPHYDHITPVIHTVTHLLDPLLQSSFILLYPCNTQKPKLLLLKEPNGHYKGTLLPSVNTDFFTKNTVCTFCLNCLF